MIINEEFVFQLSIVHAGSKFFITNGMAGDQPVNKNGYLVMVNEHGDRVAYRAPGKEWVRDTQMIVGYNTNIPAYKNAILVPTPPFENE